MSARASFAPFAFVVPFALAAACGGRVADERAQWLVRVHTDAPVPQLGDRVLVELVRPGGEPACTGCRRLFGVRTAAEWPLSFGVPDEDQAGEGAFFLRVRLFRADHATVGGGPGEGPTLDVLGALPDTGGGVREVDVMLATACAGRAADVAAGTSCDPRTGELVARTFEPAAEPVPTPGAFPAAREVPCARAASDGTVCVPGGLFVRGSSIILRTDPPSTPERLVRVDPFGLDARELTVGAYRALVARGAVTAPTRREDDPACTYTREPGAFETWPVSCVTLPAARAACAALGKRLPTEAEWELAAKNRGDESRYPWGDDTDVCAHAVVGRGRIAPTEAPVRPDLSNACRVGAAADGAVVPWGPRPVGEADDVTRLGLHDLGGNVSEWVDDAPSAYDGACSEGPVVLENPRCETGERFGALVRGGSWNGYPLYAESARRDLALTGASPFVGFRCAETLGAP